MSPLEIFETAKTKYAEKQWMESLAFLDSILTGKEKINLDFIIEVLLLKVDVLTAVKKTSDALDLCNEIIEKTIQIEVGQKTKWKSEVFHRLGSLNFNNYNYQLAIENYFKSIDESLKLNNEENICRCYLNIGRSFKALSEFSKALKFAQKTLELSIKLNLNRGIANSNILIGIIYSNMDNLDLSLDYFKKALQAIEPLNDLYYKAMCLNNIATNYYELKDYENSMIFHKNALDIKLELKDESYIASSYGNLGDLYIKLKDYSQAYFYLNLALKLNIVNNNKKLLVGNYNSLGELYVKEEFLQKDIKSAKKYIKSALSIAIDIKDKLSESKSHKILSDIYEKEEKWKDSRIEFSKFYDLEKEVKSNEVKENIRNIEIQRNLQEFEIERKVETARFKEQEKILFNMLPDSIANRILKGEKEIADYCENVSIYFSDIVGFTNLSENASPQEIVTMLNKIFIEFDILAKKHGLEKIKTIGDAYMAVAGLPIAQENHTERIALFAKDTLEVIKKYNLTVSTPISIRIGLNCGNVIAGIIGESKYVYDIWGDAVNIASRMESTGVKDKIQLSENFKKALPSSFKCIERGDLAIKGKGQMKTFFLE